jgi:hypothetical protein
MKPEQAHCKYCGSVNLVFDAAARWDVATQGYALIDTYCSRPTCSDCEQEGWADWREATDETLL